MNTDERRKRPMFLAAVDHADPAGMRVCQHYPKAGGGASDLLLLMHLQRRLRSRRQAGASVLSLLSKHACEIYTGSAPGRPEADGERERENHCGDNSDGCRIQRLDAEQEGANERRPQPG